MWDGVSLCCAKTERRNLLMFCSFLGRRRRSGRKIVPSWARSNVAVAGPYPATRLTPTPPALPHHHIWGWCEDAWGLRRSGSRKDRYGIQATAWKQDEINTQYSCHLMPGTGPFRCRKAIARQKGHLGHCTSHKWIAGGKSPEAISNSPETELSYLVLAY